MLPYTTEANVVKIVNEKLKEGGVTPSKDEIISIINEAIENGEISIIETWDLCIGGGNDYHLMFMLNNKMLTALQSQLPEYNEAIDNFNSDYGLHLTHLTKVDRQQLNNLISEAREQDQTQAVATIFVNTIIAYLYIFSDYTSYVDFLTRFQVLKMDVDTQSTTPATVYYLSMNGDNVVASSQQVDMSNDFIGFVVD